MKSFFITGTDTDVGKTYVGSRIVESFAARGLKAVGYKPIAAGCELKDGELYNDDAMGYFNASNLDVTLKEVNPITFEPPIAPHIAAQQAGQSLDIPSLITGYETLVAKQPDVIVTEGAGGWRLPLGNGDYLSSLPVQLNIDVIMVVGLRLGCLNHALLTAEAIQRDGANFKGWIGNYLSNDMPVVNENIETLRAELGEPLAMVPYASNDAHLLNLTKNL